MTSTPAVHDLLRLSAQQVEVLSRQAIDGGQDWVSDGLLRAPWAVVRRAQARAGGTPIGVRGEQRAQRWGALLDGRPVMSLPPHLLSSERAPRRDLPAVCALALLETSVANLDLPIRLGPGGSCGFEIAAGVPTLREGSDLDVVVVAPSRLDPAGVHDLHAAVSRASETSCRVDALVETPLGGVHLEELARCESPVVLRTAAGPVLVEDAWGRL